MSEEKVLKRCSSCGYEWEARIDEPKACPRCKFRIDWFARKREKEKREEEAH